MKQSHINLLKKSKIFKDLTTSQIEDVLINTKTENFAKGEFVVLQHRPLKKFGILLDGNCQIIKEDFEGNRTIMHTLEAGNFFGESIVFTSFGISPVSIIVKKATTILWFDKEFIFDKNNYNVKLIQNISEIIANKNYVLNNKIDILSKRTIKEKLMAYFYNEVSKSDANYFILPFTKSDLAEYICVERTAMYRVLKTLCDENIIDIDKRKITILNMTKN